MLPQFEGAMMDLNCYQLLDLAKDHLTYLGPPHGVGGKPPLKASAFIGRDP